MRRILIGFVVFAVAIMFTGLARAEDASDASVRPVGHTTNGVTVDTR